MEPLILPAKQLWAGFTGTREGLTPKAAKGLLDLLMLLDPRQVQHGDCVGADEKFHYMCMGMGIQVAIRPPIDQAHRAWCGPVSSPNILMFSARPFLTRNHDIVDHTDYLIACPSTMKEVLRSGTWATIRYAGKNNRMVYLVYPNGQLDRREPNR